MELNEQFVWLAWSGAFLIPWTLLFGFVPAHRRIMVQTSLATMPFGLTEPLFVPEYWSPPSLFDLALRTGFDIESLIFSFAIGGIGVVLYNAVTGAEIKPVNESYQRAQFHRHHRLAIATPFVVFPALYLLPWNPIYPAIAAMAAGAVATILCRPDLKKKTWVGGMFFTGLYWLYVAGLELLSPGYIQRVWNLDALTGFFVLGAPLEEPLFAFSFGMYWAGVYEHLTWRTTVVNSRQVTTAVPR